MRIQSIEINNYKAFYKNHTINPKGKNLFIYGENGSGKSSFYYALKDFFQSSIEPIDLSEVENIFIDDSQKGNCYIKVTFNSHGSETGKQKKIYEFSTNSKNTDSNQDTSIKDANKLKGFLTYKHLLDIHHIKKNHEIDLFNLLVKGVLQHFKYSLTEDKELGQLWHEVETIIARKTYKEYKINQKKRDLENALKTFNTAFGELFNESSPEYILKHTLPIQKYFDHNIQFKLLYGQARPNADFNSIENNHVHIQLEYAGKKIEKPHLFLNEARLSAIAISIYLGMVKRHIQGIPYKILFLDDIFIGLDIANRLPLFEILKNEFQDYQLFITTYDKPWFEHAKSHIGEDKNWSTIELYAENTSEGFEIPRIVDDQDFIKKARTHLQNSDYKAAAVYARSAFEKALISYCQKKGKKIPFKSKLKDYTSQDFWEVVKNEINPELKSKIEQFRGLVLNHYSHFNTEKHEIKKELKDAIDAVNELSSELKIL